MKSEFSNGDEVRLMGALQEWQVESSLPPQFQDQVWRRIAAREKGAAHPLQLLWEWAASRFRQPGFAVAYASALLLTGVLAGTWRAHTFAERSAESLSARYVQMIDPYQMPR